MPLGLVVALALIFALAAGSRAAEKTGALDELVKRQESLGSVQAAFSQEQYDPLLGRAIKSSGQFYFRSGKGVRWEYADALVIYDGSVLYVYSPETKEAQKIEGGKGFMGPLAFDIEDLREDYDISAERKGDAIELTLRPREEMPFSSMTMTFPKGQAFPSEVTVVQTTGEKAVIKFKDVKLNAGFSDDVFVFSPPEGTTITERRFD
ncbi:MAG: outer membrane lipoprotein carrier protein LolA [Nitrospirota bacterium]|jgi:outer membrane lipoprotein-sorting protein